MPHRRNRSDGANDSRRKFLKASGAGAVALSLAGCSGGGGQETTTDETTDETTEETTESDPNTVDETDIPEGGTFRYGMSAKPDTANPLTASSVYSGLAIYRVYQFGTSIDPVTYDVRPWIFTDWTIEESDAPDIYANVRDMKWNDGEDLTPEDIVFTYNYIKDNEVGQYAGAVEPIETVETASNDWDVHFKLNKPIGVWETDTLGGVPIIPQHKWEGEDYQQYDPMEANPDNGPVGLGPGRLTRFQPDTSMQVVFDNDHYYETLGQAEWMQDHDQIIPGGPFLDKVNFKVYGSSTAMTQALFQGEIDCHYGTLKTSRIPDAKEAEGMGLVNGLGSGFSYFGFNGRRKPLDDASLKQAMSFMFDEHFWVKRLKQDYIIKGDFSQTPGYPAPRPDYQYASEDEMLTHPATNAFDFRGRQAAIPDVEGVRSFLTNGEVIDGSEGTYVGKDYPGSLSGVSASQSEAKYEYSFGEIQSDVLSRHQNADQEIRVDGQTIPELMDGEPITIFIDPPKNQPKEAKAIQRWVDNLLSLGIPVKTQALEFNTMSARVYVQEDFDIYPMGWGGTGPFGSSAYAFFHSDNADDPTDDENSEAMLYNSTGYGYVGGSADQLLSDARTALDPDERNKLTAQALEKIYLDMPYYVLNYEKQRWPVNTEKFDGFVQNLVDPAYASFGTQIGNIHLNE